MGHKNRHIVIIATALSDFLENRSYDVNAVTKQRYKAGRLEHNKGRLKCLDRTYNMMTRSYRLKFFSDSGRLTALKHYDRCDT